MLTARLRLIRNFSQLANKWVHKSQAFVGSTSSDKEYPLEQRPLQDIEFDEPYTPDENSSVLLKQHPHIIPEYEKMPDRLAYKSYGITWEKEYPLHSAYCAVNKNGQIWHLFNLQKMHLGHAAQMAATFISGKYKPTYHPTKGPNQGDNCVFVNASKIRLSGDKRNQKKYYRHSGYAGGLKTQTFKEVEEKYPERIVHKAVRG